MRDRYRCMTSLAALVAWTSAAAAEPATPTAEDLFAEAVALREHDAEAACSKFAEAFDANPQAIGTLLNVGLCDEAAGRIASAVAKLTAVVDRAREQRYEEYLRVAEQRLVLLKPELPYLTITFAEAPLAETKVLIDDRIIPLADLIKKPGKARLAVDPGNRVIVVTAPGRVAFRTLLRFAKRADQHLEVPPLGASVVTSSRRTIGKLAVVAGLATTGAGVALVLVARSRYDAPFESGECNRTTLACNSDQGSSAVESARTLGDVSTVVTIVGLGATVAGAYLWLRAPQASERAVTVLPHVLHEGVGFVAVGRW